MNILVWQYIQMPYFVSIIRSFLIFYFMGLVIHHWRKFLKQILSIAIDNLQFRLVFTSVKFCCKKVWWCVFYYVPSNKVLCLSKNWWKKYQSISSKYESFRMIFKLVRKSTFEQNYTFYVIIWDFFGRAQSENNFMLFFFFNYVTFTKPHPLNRFVGKFWSSRSKTNYQYYFNMQLKCGK